MKMSDIPFGTTDWNAVEPTRHDGDCGYALWRTQKFGPEINQVRVRMVEYSAGYVSDHWCQKGHILFHRGRTRDNARRVYTLKPGSSYQVADEAEPHRSRTAIGAKLFVVD